MLKLEDFKQQIAAYREKWMVYDQTVYPSTFFALLLLKEEDFELIEIYEYQFDKYEIFQPADNKITMTNNKGEVIGSGTIPVDNIFPTIKQIK